MLTTLSTLTGAGGISAQTQPQDSPIRIEVDVIGGVQRERGEWAELRSDNFVVAGDADEEDLRAAASELELFRSSFARIFPTAA